jgi:hypothetical protein
VTGVYKRADGDLLCAEVLEPRLSCHSLRYCPNTCCEVFAGEGAELFSELVAIWEKDRLRDRPRPDRWIGQNRSHRGEGEARVRRVSSLKEAIMNALYRSHIRL